MTVTVRLGIRLPTGQPTPPSSGPVWWRLVRVRALLLLLAGMALPFSLAPYGIWPVALLAPALLYAGLRDTTPKQAFWLGEAFGFGLWVVGAFWLFTSINDYSETPTPVAFVMILIMALGMGLFTAVTAWLYRRFFLHSPLPFAALWTVLEWCKTWLFTGFPWLFVGYAFTERTLDGFAPLAGVFAVSFATILISGSLAELLRRRWAWGSVPLLAVATAFGLNQLTWVTPKALKPLSVSLIQGNIPQDLKWLTEYRVKTLEIYETLSRREWGRDLVVWPEASIPMFQTEAAEVVNAVNEHAKQTRSTWVTGIPWQATDEGTPDSDYTPFYNAILAAGFEGHGLYYKQRLVPYGEYVPFEGALKWVLPSLKRNPEISSFSRGSANQRPLSVRGQPMGSALCYEVAYPNITRRNARGTDYMVTVSNDAWFGTSNGPFQHLQMVQMRAKETGRWFIRATNTGITAFIDEQGHIRGRAPQFERTVLRGELPAMQGTTPYVRFGDWPILAVCALLLTLGGWVRYRYAAPSAKA